MRLSALCYLWDLKAMWRLHLRARLLQKLRCPSFRRAPRPAGVAWHTGLRPAASAHAAHEAAACDGASFVLTYPVSRLTGIFRPPRLINKMPVSLCGVWCGWIGTPSTPSLPRAPACLEGKPSHPDKVEHSVVTACCNAGNLQGSAACAMCSAYWIVERCQTSVSAHLILGLGWRHRGPPWPNVTAVCMLAPWYRRPKMGLGCRHRGLAPHYYPFFFVRRRKGSWTHCTSSYPPTPTRPSSSTLLQFNCN